MWLSYVVGSILTSFLVFQFPAYHTKYSYPEQLSEICEPGRGIDTIAKTLNPLSPWHRWGMTRPKLLYTLESLTKFQNFNPFQVPAVQYCTSLSLSQLWRTSNIFGGRRPASFQPSTLDPRRHPSAPLRKHLVRVRSIPLRWEFGGHSRPKTGLPRTRKTSPAGAQLILRICFSKLIILRLQVKPTLSGSQPSSGTL
jgi:hypothetical protein